MFRHNMYWKMKEEKIIAECLSIRLLILQSVFLAGGVWPQLLSHLGKQINVLFTKGYVNC